MEDNIVNKSNDVLVEKLDKQIRVCAEYSEIVMDIYEQILFNISYSDVSDELKLLRNYLIKEYNEYKILLSYDKSILLSKLDSLIGDNYSLNNLRYRNLLQFFKNISLGYKISSSELGIKNISMNTEFDLYSMLLTIIYINVFKCLKIKLDNLKYNNSQDYEFVEQLYKELNIRLLTKGMASDSLGFITIFNDLNINKIQYIDINAIINKMNKIYGEDTSKIRINNVFFELIMNDLSMICKRKYLNNEPKDVFNYLYFITRIEVIISYMDKNSLLHLLEEINSLTFNNNYFLNDINNKIRKRISSLY